MKNEEVSRRLLRSSFVPRTSNLFLDVKRFATVLLLFVTACAHTTPDFIRGPQGRLHVDDGGRGDALPLLFVHGNGANLTQWRDALAHARASRRAVAFDLHGMGLSDPAANGDYSVAAMVDDVDAVANALGMRRFVLIGHSYGSHVVAAYAAKHPERVAAVVHVDGAGNIKATDAQAKKFTDALRRDKDAVVAQWFAPILADAQPATRDAVLASVHATNTEAFVEALDGARKVDLVALVAAYHGPRFAIFAKPLEKPGSFHVQFPQVPARGIDGVSHWLMMDKPAELNAALDDFLKKI